MLHKNAYPLIPVNYLTDQALGNISKNDGFVGLICVSIHLHDCINAHVPFDFKLPRSLWLDYVDYMLNRSDMSNPSMSLNGLIDVLTNKVQADESLRPMLGFINYLSQYIWPKLNNSTKKSLDQVAIFSENRVMPELIYDYILKNQIFCHLGFTNPLVFDAVEKIN